jgi:hypothetical protein
MVLNPNEFREMDSTHEIEQMLTFIKDEVKKELFRSDPIKALALQRIVDSIESLLFDIQLPKQQGEAIRTAERLIDVWQVQRLLRNKRLAGFSADTSPYLFLKPLHSKSIGRGFGLKVKVKGEFHNRIFVKIRVSIDENGRFRLEVIDYELQNRHGAYQ